MDFQPKELVFRYCEGQLSKEEVLTLLQWVRESSSNAEEFRRIEKEWRNSHVTSPQARLAVAAARNVLDKYSIRRKKYVSISSIAAAIMMLGAFLFFGRSDYHFFRIADADKPFSVMVPMSSISEVSLPDGTRVVLNAGSRLDYGRDFNKKNRDVFLSGEAYFDVAQDKDLPFVVHTEDCKMTVLGTRFDVYAYKGEGVTYAALLEGSLRFDAGTSMVLISPDEVATFDGMSIIKSVTETDQYISWVNGEIMFNEINLSEFFHRLSRLYDVRISYEENNLNARKFRAAFTQKEKLENVLNAVSSLLPITIEKDGGGYVVLEQD